MDTIRRSSNHLRLQLISGLPDIGCATPERVWRPGLGFNQSSMIASPLATSQRLEPVVRHGRLLFGRGDRTSASKRVADTLHSNRLVTFMIGVEGPTQSAASSIRKKLKV